MSYRLGREGANKEKTVRATVITGQAGGVCEGNNVVNKCLVTLHSVGLEDDPV